MIKHLRIVAPLLATAALAAGCGGGDSDQNSASQQVGSSYSSTKPESTPAATETAAATATPVAKKAEAKVVEMTGSTFQPADIDLKVGDTVTFVNKDEIAHNATSDAFESGTMEAGAKFSFTADKAGKISYVCTFHPGMTGTINVT